MEKGLEGSSGGYFFHVSFQAPCSSSYYSLALISLGCPESRSVRPGLSKKNKQHARYF